MSGYLLQVQAPLITSSLKTDGTFSTAAAGHRYLQITADSTEFDNLVADQLAGCVLIFSAGTGAPYSYFIRSNTAVATRMVQFELQQGLKAAPTTNSDDVALQPSRVSNLIASLASESMGGGITGVTMATTTSALPFAWVQTRGRAIVLGDGTNTIGSVVVQSDGTAGAVQVEDAYTEPRLGYCLDTIVTTEYGPIMLSGGMD